MADLTRQVIVEFVTNDEQLKSSEDRLVNLGKTEKQNAEEFKKANTEINKQVQSLKNLEAVNSQFDKSGNNLKKTLIELAAQVKGMGGVFQKEFKSGITQALKEAGISLQQVQKELRKAGVAEQELISIMNALTPTTDNLSTSEVELKKQLGEVVKQLRQMKAAGLENTVQYQELIDKAAAYKKVLNDVNQEIKATASSTSALDGLIGVTTGVAGGFSVAQGAIALFGSQSEDLQKTLVRVNATMAILQGLQSIQNILQKESAASILVTTIATKAQTAAQVVFNLVVGKSTGLLKAFKIALASTGVGLLVIGLGYLVSKLIEFADAGESSTEVANKFADALERINKDAEGAADNISRQSELRIAQLNKEGAKQSEINKVKLAETQRLLKAEEFNAKRIGAQLDDLRQKRLDGLLNQKDYEEQFKAFDAAHEKSISRQIALDQEYKVGVINNQKDIIDEQKKAAEEAKRIAKERAEKERELRAAGFADFKASVELELLAAEEGSEEQLEIRKRLARAQLQIELDNEKLTINQRRLLIKQYFKERIDLEKEFARDRDKIILENIASDIQADLQALEITNERKLELTETAIQIQAQLEIDAANGNAAKITEINAKRDKAIRDARIASIQETLDYELRLAAAENGPEKRRLQNVINNADEEFRVRITAINQITAFELDAIGRRIAALNEERAKKLISEKDYNLQYKELTDQQVAITESSEKQKTEIALAEAEKRKQATIREIQEITEVASTVVSVLDALYSLQSQSENNRIAEQKQRLKDLQEAGAITEKEAISRQKRIEAEERKIRQAQAQREKQIAVFNALLAVPQSYLKGLEQGGLALAIIYGAIAAAQAAIVISRPVPKFAKGKKDAYEGFGEVGEAGTELIQKDGRMYVADKPQVIWLAKNDKVFNPMETAAMMGKTPMNTERLQPVPVKAEKIDYEKMGKEVGKHLKTNVYVDGQHKQTIEKNAFTKWLGDRREL